MHLSFCHEYYVVQTFGAYVVACISYYAKLASLTGPTVAVLRPLSDEEADNFFSSQFVTVSLT